MTAQIDAVLQRNADGIFDISIDGNGDILTDDFFDTSLLMTVYCERRANGSEVPVAEKRRGWIGNEATPGFEIGSKLWLYSQARVNRDTINGAVSALREGLQWLLDDNLAIDINVTDAFIHNEVNIVATITRPSGRVEQRYYDFWNNTGQRPL